MCNEGANRDPQSLRAAGPQRAVRYDASISPNKIAQPGALRVRNSQRRKVRGPSTGGGQPSCPEAHSDKQSDVMPPKRKRKPSPPAEPYDAAQPSSGPAAPSIDRPGKKRKLEATPRSGGSPKPNQEGTKGPEPSKTTKRPRQSDGLVSTNIKASSPKPSSAPAKRKRPKIVKLDPVAFLGNTLPGSNPTGPWSQRGEGKNRIAITRRLGLGAYLRRCVELVNIDGCVNCSCQGAD
jgi:hypothetical protein